MTEAQNLNPKLPDVREDYIPKIDYVSGEFAKLESERLWKRVWQVACREEDIPHPRNFETYNIVDQSITVLRTEDNEIKAFHNACTHRGRELTEGCGSMNKFHCRFHGWQWDLDGQITRVPQREDWNGCSGMSDADLSLTPVKVATWGGFVFINMDPDCEPFEDFINPLPKYLDCLEIDKWRYTWRKVFKLKANWKTAIEAFMESYHVPYTHPQAVPVIDSASFSSTHGKHGRHKYYWERPLGSPAEHTKLPMPDDWRAATAAVGDFTVAELSDVNGGKLDSQMTLRSCEALQRHLTDTPEGLSQPEISMLSLQYMAEAAIAEGAGWPQPTLEEVEELGADWSMFPNIALVHSLDATLFFWSRPDGRDPESCVFQMAALGRVPLDKHEKVEVEHLDDWERDIKKIPHLLSQDLSNIESVQRGMHSISLEGLRTNPKQETQISHFHEVLHSYLDD